MSQRIFISIDLPGGLKAELRILQNPEIRWIKWMKPQNFHITLNFLGDLEEDEIEKAKSILLEVGVNHNPFPLRFQGIDGERDMLWLALATSPALDDLQSELRQKLREARLGKRERREYVPHVLLAKSKTGRAMTWRPDRFELEGREFLVDRINLYESRLTPGSATHILIKSFQIG